MQILPGVHQIPCIYHDRPLNLYLLIYGNESLLMDTGDATVPPNDILPYFQKINFNPKNLTYVLLTHPDLDHTGGIYEIQAAAPQAQFLCGTQDAEQIQTPEALGRIRARAHYYWHNLGPDDAKLATYIQKAGGPGKKITFAKTFSGGESLHLGYRTVEILHLPGHSMGHLGVFLPWENAAIIGDAVHGTANRFLTGQAAFACTYMYIDAYLGTIDRLQAMRLDKLFSCHWPNCTTNDQVNAFLNESRNYCLHAEAAILETLLAAGPNGLTLKDICTLAKPKLGDWPPEKDSETRSMALGHLQHLCQLGLATATPDRPTRYLPVPQWLGLK